ncbi:caspase-7-like [Tubulanus polymorphus]|uniref:caspase-7-like n=1 Tax=Tubulanus polymorphus TaxID=672921 RepID=UPI003DA63411
MTDQQAAATLCYNFNEKNRGVAVVINQKYFYESTKQLTRDGTDIDAVNIANTLVDLGFEVHRYDDLLMAEMHKLMRKFGADDHTDSDCFVCVILSHGIEGRVYGVDGSLSIETLVAPFKGDRCASLVGKPKLFFIQACRGTKFMHSVEVDQTDAAPDVKIQTIPTEADFLMAYSVVPGHFSWRNNVDGSWFIQAICRVLKEVGTTMELMHMMIYVNRIVAYEFKSCTDRKWTDGMKQIPAITSMLTKLVYFNVKDCPKAGITLYKSQSQLGDHEYK